GLHEALELHLAEPRAYLARGLDHLGKAKAGTGVEIEHQPIGALAVVVGGAADMDFQSAALHQRVHTVEIIDRNDLVALLGDEAQKLGRYARPRMLLKKALAYIGAFGTTYQC